MNYISTLTEKQRDFIQSIEDILASEHLLDTEVGFNASNQALSIEIAKKIVAIWSEIKEVGYATRTGSDSDLRGAFVLLQAVIDRAILESVDITTINIITPSASTPLMLSTTDATFGSIDLDKAPRCFAELRSTILKNILAKPSSNIHINAVYSRMEYTPTLDDINGLYNMAMITLSKNEFPQEKSGAIYTFGGDIKNAITLHAHQIGHESDDATWALSFFGMNHERVKEIAEFMLHHRAHKDMRTVEDMYDILTHSVETRAAIDSSDTGVHHQNTIEHTDL